MSIPHNLLQPAKKVFECLEPEEFDGYNKFGVDRFFKNLLKEKRHFTFYQSKQKNKDGSQNGEIAIAKDDIEHCERKVTY